MNSRHITFITTIFWPRARLEQVGAPARRAGREVERPQQALVLGDVGDDVALVPDMVAGGDAVDAGIVQLGADLGGDAEARGGVLAVDDDEIEAELAGAAAGCSSITASRPDRPTMSPQNRTFMAQTKAQARLSVNNQSSRWSFGPCGTSGTSCALKPTPIARDVFLARKRLERAVVEAAAIAQPPALLVDRPAAARSARRARRTSRLGDGCSVPNTPCLERIARPPGAEDQRLLLGRPRPAARAGSPG